MAYFTIFHFFALVGVFIALIALLYFSLRGETSVKKAVWLVIIEFLAAIAVGTLFMMMIDEYTKKARVRDMTYQRVLINETMMFSGFIENVGGFEISSCTLKIKLINSPSVGKLSPDIFKPKGFWDVVLFKDTKKVSTVEEKVRVGMHLRPGQNRPFSAIIPYPPGFEAPSIHYTLDCR